MKIAFHFYSNYILVFNPVTGFYLEQKDGEVTDHGVMRNESRFAGIINLKLYNRFEKEDDLARIESLDEENA